MEPIGEGNQSKWFVRRKYKDPKEKKRDFWIGFWLYFGLNILLFLCNMGTYSLPIDFGSDFYNIVTFILSLLPWVLNLGLLVYFAFTRGQIALGMLAGFGASLLITICLGLIFTLWCFATL